MKEKHENYNIEPVRYCSECYSLAIKYEDSLDTEVCSHCGCTKISETSIEEWEALYEKRYGHKFVEKNRDPRQSIWFKASIEKLKRKLYRNSKLRDIINGIYPNFPKGLSRTDSILLFFNQLIKDNRIEELRYWLYNHFENSNI